MCCITYTLPHHTTYGSTAIKLIGSIAHNLRFVLDSQHIFRKRNNSQCHSTGQCLFRFNLVENGTHRIFRQFISFCIEQYVKCFAGIFGLICRPNVSANTFELVFTRPNDHVPIIYLIFIGFHRAQLFTTRLSLRNCIWWNYYFPHSPSSNAQSTHNIRIYLFTFCLKYVQT